ncbi:MAG: hypothetical protein Q8S53_14780 [Brevundimonas sp.]|nr:hypothetical protein [Brevundimonas sp.]MDP3379627.1 hypothetical protein [Brevundimonas sp.]
MLRRLTLIAALAALSTPLLAGCIIVATDKPETRVIHAPAHED